VNAARVKAAEEQARIDLKDEIAKEMEEERNPMGLVAWASCYIF
jgi:hypothetical protein